MAKINLKNVSKAYGKKLVVKNLNFEINDKELIVLLGPSGCGKSTTMNCIAGIDTPTSGRIYFDDEDVTDYPAHVRNVAMVFQSAILYPHLTGLQNLKISLRLSKLSEEEKNHKIEEVSNLLNIGHLLNQLPSQLSGGERQRVATAKAIIRNPRVFLMDEPLASLDAAMREVLRTEIVVLQKKLGITMIFVTHDQTEGMTLGDRIAVMNSGELLQIGTPDDIYHKPINTFVATFVGTPPMNLFKGVLKIKSDSKYFFSHENFELEIPDSMVKNFKEPVRDTTEVILGVRPQNLKLFDDMGKENTIKGKVYNVEKLGKESIIIMDYGTNKEKIKIIEAGISNKNLEEKICAFPDIHHIFLFDAKSEKNMCL